ncbi:MAG: WYL domain-containing protein [Pigmentiphaga sp.]|uniref:helix-turn-helix transcriptional regulator n=1 Tax=Pigmentiphaga sp. TaxID=1977564 RepID=UPI0029B0D92E|nr:WYL domain-containing protein [Pigmentiphaga sp.]MDX3907699.1 WYL domain-containing protein [Pigmentiphaga sp.]
MSQDRLRDLSHPQRDRLAYIEQKLWFVGDMRRQDLVDRFGIQTAAATRDFSLYRELAPGNMAYDSRTKIYLLGPDFKPLFTYSPERILTWLSEGFGDGEPISSRTGIICDIPSRLAQPDLATLAIVTRAIKQQQVLRIKYHSLSTGKSEREIVPFALLDTGLRWHARAYDRKSGEFRDFVLTRIMDASVVRDSVTQDRERPDQDIQWSRIVELELVPHPDQPHPKVTEMDYGMRDGVLKMRVRAATVGYTLRKWSVDCSPDHSLRGPEFRLWLKDHLALYGVVNAVLAPGYVGINK